MARVPWHRASALGASNSFCKLYAASSPAFAARRAKAEHQDLLSAGCMHGTVSQHAIPALLYGAREASLPLLSVQVNHWLAVACKHGAWQGRRAQHVPEQQVLAGGPVGLGRRG